MLHRYSHGPLVWIDLESPTHDDVRTIMDEFGIDPLVAEELLLPTPKPRTELHEQYVYLILHFPALKHTHNTTVQEVDFVIGQKFIITTRYELVDPLHKFSKIFEVNSVLDKSNLGDHAGYIFYYMLRKLYKSVEHEVAYIGDMLDDVEAQIFEGREREMVSALSRIGRNLLNLRQAIEPHRDVLRQFETNAEAFFGTSYRISSRNLLNEYFRVHGLIQRHSESLKELRETNNSLLTTKQNEIMKVLTIMAFVTFPLTLITGVFGMNTASTPIADSPYGFWIIMGIMGAAGTLMFSYFKRKHWL